MGPAHSTVKNHTERRICVITFTNSDLVYLSYNTLYVIEPGSSQLVESQPDPVGLKIGLVYDIDIEKKELLYQRFVCKTDSVLNIGELEYDEISWFGDNITGYTKGKLKETNITAFTMAKEAVDNVAPTVGKRNGKFEKELIKRVTTDYMEKHNIHINMNSSLKSGSSDMNLDQYNNTDSNGNTQPGSNSFYNKSKVVEDEKSAAEKWTLQLEKLREAAAIKEAKLAESQALIAERLARVAEEEAQAAELEKQREEEKRLEEIRQKEIEKIRKEQEHDELVKEKKGKKGKKKSKEKEKSSSSGCNIM